MVFLSQTRFRAFFLLLCMATASYPAAQEETEEKDSSNSVPLSTVYHHPGTPCFITQLPSRLSCERGRLFRRSSSRNRKNSLPLQESIGDLFEGNSRSMSFSEERAPLSRQASATSDCMRFSGIPAQRLSRTSKDTKESASRSSREDSEEDNSPLSRLDEEQSVSSQRSWDREDSPFPLGQRSSFLRRNPSDRLSRPMAFWELSLPLVESWDLKDLDHIGRFTEVAAELQTILQDEERVLGIMTLGARYVHEVTHRRLGLSEVVDLVLLLGQLEDYYPRANEPLTSQFAYDVMIKQQKVGAFSSWVEQTHYLWQASYSFHKANDPFLAENIMDRLAVWVSPLHSIEQREIIHDLLMEIVLNNPQNYASILYGAENQLKVLQLFEVIPFLRGITTATRAYTEATFSPISEAFASTPVGDQSPPIFSDGGARSFLGEGHIASSEIVPETISKAASSPREVSLGEANAARIPARRDLGDFSSSRERIRDTYRKL